MSLSASLPTVAIPRTGMLATVRNRRALIRAVEPFDGGLDGRVHLVTLEYLDADGIGEDLLIWEREPGARVLEPTALPNPVGEEPMVPDEFDALVRATRWTALSPFDTLAQGPTAPDRLPLAAPFHGAIQIEDFQLIPLLKALRMPRVALLLADDVGLGKTIEAGLILAELIRRRRVRRILVLCPASLRTQWQQELWDKFALTFDIVDRQATHALSQRFGLDANPWRMLPRLITSYDYLKQSDVFEQFRAACHVPVGSPHLPWDLLIVDEVHNLTPAPFGEESDAARMLRLLAPWFEHKLFLTATPHNGHTRSFTGLLEALDPVRFTRTSEPLTASERARVEEVVVRRLKSEINAVTSPPRFGSRTLREVRLRLDTAERALADAYQAFRARLYALMTSTPRREQHAGAFALEVLGKRLLSCPVAFADSWHRYRRGITADEAARVEEVHAAARALGEETADDSEAESRMAHAARTVGAWLQPFAERLAPEMAAIDQALATLGLDHSEGPPAELVPTADARFAALAAFIQEQLCTPTGAFRDEERLVIFTEYKTTLDYLARRLRACFPEESRLHMLYGGTELGKAQRERIKQAFNDSADPVRILLATDVASEGLNLHETARLLLHYDVPWNPARLEQRNGRLDRHGQARDVLVHYFVTDDDADLAFLAYVVSKVHTIRDDLGATGEIFEEALERRLIAGEEHTRVRRDLDSRLARARGRAAVPRPAAVEHGQEALRDLEALRAELDLDPVALRETLDIALGLGVGRPRLEGPDARGRFRLAHPIPPAWQALVDDVLRLNRTQDTRGALPGFIFDAAQWMQHVGERPVFRPTRDTVLLHLGHPLLHAALAIFARARFPGRVGAIAATRWTVRHGPVPAGTDALVVLTVEERAVNALRETFHHWVRTLCLPVQHGILGAPLPHVPARALRLPASVPSPSDITYARELWDEVTPDVRHLVGSLAVALTERVQAALTEVGHVAMTRENERFQSRQGEVSALIAATTLQRLEREIAGMREEADQGVLFDREQRLTALERSIAEKEAEVRRRRAQYDELREQLQRERERVLRHLLPQRYTLRDTAHVFPVAVEIRLPEAQQ